MGILTASLSKIGLLGLRIGWIAARKEVTESCWCCTDYTTLSHSGLSEYLATVALRKNKIEELREKARAVFTKNLEILKSWIKESAGELDCVIPKAGGSAFPRYKLNRDAVRVCE